MRLTAADVFPLHLGDSRWCVGFLGTAIQSGAKDPKLGRFTASVLAGTDASALTANTSILRQNGVLWRERMSMLAMRFLGVLSRKRFAAQQVLAARNWFQMTRVKARSVAAQVVNLQPVWDWAAQHLVHQTVRLNTLAIVLYPRVMSSGVGKCPAFVRLTDTAHKPNDSVVFCTHTAI